MPKWMPTASGALVAVSFSVIRFLPVRISSELMALVFGRVRRLFIKEAMIKRNLQAAFPALDDVAVDEMIKRMAANFGRHIAEVVHISTFKNDARGTCVTYEGSPANPFIGQGPAIYVGAHLGSWELIPIVFQRHARPLTIIYSLIDNAFIDRTLLSLRQKTGATYVEKPDALRACMKAMQRGESVALLVDQRVKAGVEVDFFGHRSTFTPLPVRLAIRFNRPIIPLEAVRLAPGRVQVIFHEPILPGASTGKQAEIDLTQKMATAIEAAISRHPDTWFCHKRRWAKENVGSAPQFLKAAE